MNGTALYRALVHAGAPEDEAKEAADGIVDADKFDKTIEAIKADIKTIFERINSLELRMVRLETLFKINIGISVAIFLLMLKMAFS